MYEEDLAGAVFEMELEAPLIHDFKKWVAQHAYRGCRILRSHVIITELDNGTWDDDDEFAELVYGDIICGGACYRVIFKELGDLYAACCWRE